jgi:hypothetical protein
VQALVDAGLIPAELLWRAGREADLLEHPYIGHEHLELARMRAEGREAEYNDLRATVRVGLRRRWWRPLGRRSALRRRGLRETRDARRAAEHDR